VFVSFEKNRIIKAELGSLTFSTLDIQNLWKSFCILMYIWENINQCAKMSIWQSGFKCGIYSQRAQLPHLICYLGQVSLASTYFSFLICKLKIITVPTSQGWCGNKWVNACKVLRTVVSKAILWLNKYLLLLL